MFHDTLQTVVRTHEVSQGGEEVRCVGQLAEGALKPVEPRHVLALAVPEQVPTAQGKERSMERQTLG